jgi:hypothetical protein
MYATSTHAAAGVKPASNDAIIVPNGGLFFSRRLKLQRLLVKEKMIIKYNLVGRETLHINPRSS